VRNLNQPNGLACIPNTGVAGVPCQAVAVGQYQPGQGPFAPVFFNGGSTLKETPVTPKFGVSYQADSRNLFYGSVSKGYRIGGAQDLQPSACNNELIQLGYTDSSGRASSPPTFDSDTVWSYELGAKNRVGPLQLDSSVYYIKWKNVQNQVPLSTCGRTFVDNLGDATSKGFDVTAQVEVMRNLLMSASVAYTKATFDQPIVLNRRLIYSDSSALPSGGAPWTIILSGQYDFQAFGQDAYLRGDYTYTSKLKGTGPSDPASVNYDALVPARGETNLLNARVGVKVSDIDLSLFVNNLTNASPSIGYTRTRGQPVYTDTTFRPRTAGVTMSYRY
jgi:outer membrane receptor protein involved in Fe transport